MFKAIIIIVIAVGVIIGGLLTLRNSGRAGMPSADVLQRASKRAREQADAENDEEGRSPK
jgi:FtsZ-interacting cell division protein ZipA